MPDHKKNQISADDQKASSIAPDASLTPPVSETKKKIRKAPKVKKKKKKGLPIVLDILIVIVLLAAIAGAVFGIYSTGKYFSTRYAQVEITYTLLLDDVDAVLAYDDDGECVITSDSYVYMTENEQGHSLGQVLDVECVADSQQESSETVDIYVTVHTVADYNYTLGYFVGQTKIAVGKSYILRFEGLMNDAVIVELQINEKAS